jgi:hypothetical protein
LLFATDIGYLSMDRLDRKMDLTSGGCGLVWIEVDWLILRVAPGTPLGSIL